MMDWLIWISTSDFCGPGPTVPEWLTNQAGHIGIGVVLGLLTLVWRPAAVIFFIALLAKELAFDIARCDAQQVVLLDSLLDVGFCTLGLRLSHSFLANSSVDA